MIVQPDHPYFQRLYRRTGHPVASPAASPTPPARPAGRITRRRYAALQQQPSDIDELRSGGISDAPVTSLGEAFSKVRDEQAKAQRPRGWARIAAHPIKSAIAAVLLLAVLGTAAVVVPLLYRANEAYQKVFVEPENMAGPGIAADVNEEGTVVVVTVTPTPQDAALPKWNGSDRVTILLLGVDKREDEASRSDTMILVNIDPVEKTARMLSIPRDLKVIIPGYGAQKINAAYAFGDADAVPGGGAGLMMRTIEANFGIDIDYYAQVDFNGFTDIVDTVGGVTLDVPYPIRDDEFPGPGNQYMRIHFQAGWQHMDGERVLQYARTRHDDGDGRRAVRQQQVLLALREQAITRDLIRDAPELITEVGDTVRTDLDSGQVLQLVRLASEINQSEIVQMTINDALVVYEDPEFYFSADWEMVGGIMSEFMGTEVIPPMSALDNPRYDAPIQILDGVINPGLGQRIADVLTANGFTDVTVIELDTAGNYPTSSITTSGDDLTTAYLLAGLLGIPDGGVVAQQEVMPTAVSTNQPSPTPGAGGSPAAGDGGRAAPEVQPLFPTAEGGEDATTDGPAGPIIIQLGDDVPDPAYYNQELYTDEPVE